VEYISDPLHLAAVLLAGLLAGAGNTVAGGGTTLSFPILVWVGLPDRLANATNTLGLLAGSAGGAWSYRSRIRGSMQGGGGWQALWVPAFFGGAAGAALLLWLPPTWFTTVAPWMVIGSAALVAADPLMRRHLPHPAPGTRRLGSSLTAMFLVAVYGGYFGSGIGILVLITLGLLGISDLHDANALKNLLVIGIKGIASLWFVVSGVIVWPVAVVMLVSSTVGGWWAGHLIQKVDAGTLRWMVVGIGAAMGVLMLVGR
jgi:uncharacterized membrane protein YfcA